MNNLVMPLGFMMVISTLPAICFFVICEFIDMLRKREKNDRE